jgi:murein endopeptidase
VTFILEGFDALRSEHRGAPRVEMHDISDEDGGEINDHNSHESGRDADIGLYHDDCDDTCSYDRLDADDLDVELQWALISHWIENDQVEYIFLDYSLQEPLYEYAQSLGATESELNDWFQYPHGRRRARGILRHEPNHRDHIHVRFACSQSDDNRR